MEKNQRRINSNKDESGVERGEAYRIGNNLVSFVGELECKLRLL